MAAMVADGKTPLMQNSIAKAFAKEELEGYTAVQTHSDLFRLIEKSRFYNNPSSDDIKLSQETDYPISYNQVQLNQNDVSQAHLTDIAWCSSGRYRRITSMWLGG